jgi:hypothetical protein
MPPGHGWVNRSTGRNWKPQSDGTMGKHGEPLVGEEGGVAPGHGESMQMSRAAALYRHGVKGQ